MVRFQRPLIEPDARISRIRLSDEDSLPAHAIAKMQRPEPLQPVLAVAWGALSPARVPPVLPAARFRAP